MIDQLDPAWHPEPDEIRSVRWLPLESLAGKVVHPPHQDALRLFNLI